MEHEGESLRRLQGLQHHEERESDRVRDDRIGLRIPVGPGDHGFGHVRGVLGILIKGLLPARSPRPQQVQAHTRRARDDGREPGAQVLDVADIGPSEPNPALLDRILGFARGPEHPIRHRAQMRPVLFELLGEPLRCGHRSHSSVAVRQGSDGRNIDDVTERREK